eukprot:gene17905-biopygen3425
MQARQGAAPASRAALAFLLVGAHAPWCDDPMEESTLLHLEQIPLKGGWSPPWDHHPCARRARGRPGRPTSIPADSIAPLPRCVARPLPLHGTAPACRLARVRGACRAGAEGRENTPRAGEHAEDQEGGLLPRRACRGSGEHDSGRNP